MMAGSLGFALEPTRLRCVVCATALLTRQIVDAQRSQDPFPSCEMVACRMVVSRRGEMSDAGFKHYLQIEARQTQGRIARAKLAQEKSAAEAHENLAAWGKLMRRLAPESSQAQPLQLLVPSGPARASKLTMQRRRIYRDHLAKIIAEALKPPDLGEESALEPQPQAAIQGLNHSAQTSSSRLAGRLCAFCGGGCCTRGGNEAYLTAATIRRVLMIQAVPQTPSDLLAVYLDRLPSKAQTGSCINHGSQGCTLNPELRSDICNNYACEALARLQYAQGQVQNSPAQRPETSVLVLRRKQDNWLRGTLGLDNAIKAGALLSEAGAEQVTTSRLLGKKAAG
jgi:hypothetical protein